MRFQETAFLTRPGAEVAYDFFPAPVTSQNVNEVLLLVNGFQRPRSDFRALRKRLHEQSEHLVTAALDNRGVGETVCSGEFSLIDMAQDVGALAVKMKAAWPDARLTLLGISMGGMIAQRVAADFPTDVNRLVLVSTTGGGNTRVWPAPLAERPREWQPWPRDPEVMLNTVRSYFGSRFLKSSPLIVKAMAQNILKASENGKADAGARWQFAASSGFDGTSLHAKIQQPCLVVTGDEDHVIPPENSQVLAGAIANSRLLTYPGVGHLILAEEPEVFAKDLLDFFA